MHHQQEQEQEIAQENLSPDPDSITETKITQHFYTFLKLTNDDEAVEENDDDDEVADNDDGEEEEFSFLCGGADTSPISAEEAFINGQIKPTMFPISFDQDHLPTRPPVNNLFVEAMSEGHPHVTGHVTAVESSSSSPETYCKKSNSTGFSKIWRFKDLMGRSNSDGRDAFVFLNNNNNNSNHDATNPDVKVATEKVVKGKKAKKGGKAASSLSAHEVYLRRSKAAKAGEERRRSYLPYRPGLMGFFTNVSGGLLTKNVHPY